MFFGAPFPSFFHKSNVKPLKEAKCKNPELTFRSLFFVVLLVSSFVVNPVYYNWHGGKGCCVHVTVAYKNCSGTDLKGVFAKNERGFRLYAIKKRFWSLLILLLSVASIWRKLLKTTNTEERSAHTNSERCNIRLRP